MPAGSGLPSICALSDLSADMGLLDLIADFWCMPFFAGFKFVRVVSLTFVNFVCCNIIISLKGLLV